MIKYLILFFDLLDLEPQPPNPIILIQFCFPLISILLLFRLLLQFFQVLPQQLLLPLHNLILLFGAYGFQLVIVHYVRGLW